MVNSRFLADVNDEVAPVWQTESEQVVKPGGWTHTVPQGSVTEVALRRR
jgi:hypothetical protein